MNDVDRHEVRLPEAAPARPPRKLEVLEDELRRSAKGRELLDVIHRHVAEVMGLVNHNRRVTVVWQKNQGPAFVLAAVDSGFDDNARIPQLIHGVRLDELLLRMADVLQRHGTLELRRAIADHALTVLGWARDATSLKELFRAVHDADAASEGE